MGKAPNMEWESVIGLEAHVQLATRSKIFSGASAAFGGDANAQACGVDLGLPGTLPVLNREAVRMALTFGLAIGADIAPTCRFDRKNYFYPDLPKGYQISQLDAPIVGRGTLAIDAPDGERRIGITRAHLEEDAGKSLHEEFSAATGVDLNRAGTPLLEIVSEPDLRMPAQAGDYMRKLHALVTTLEICDGNMQEGSMRCDANVSIRKKGDPKLGTRTELKNINSFRFVEKGIEAEIRRQIEVLESGGTIVQETRQYDAQKNLTRPMRGKEDAQDYRYFPDPDLPPLVLSEEFIDELRNELPELPEQKLQRFMQNYGLSEADCRQIVQNSATADYFETALAEAPNQPKIMANWMNVELASYLNRNNLKIEDSRISPKSLGQLVHCITSGVISGNSGKSLLEAMWNQPEATVNELVDQLGLKQSTDTGQLTELIDRVLSENPGPADQYRQGNQKVLGFLVGQVLKASTDKLDPKAVSTMLRNRLDA